MITLLVNFQIQIVNFQIQIEAHIQTVDLGFLINIVHL